jgi:hypothetical protein
MKQTLKLAFSLLLIVLIQSCNSTPDEFNKGYEFFTNKNYDSSLYYFDRVPSDNEAWIDSVKAMKIMCFTGMAQNQKWKMLGLANTTFSADTALIAKGSISLEKVLTSIWKKDSMDMFYRVIDEHGDNLPNSAIKASLNKYEDKMLLGYYWEGIRAYRGMKLYFSREIIKDYRGNDEGLKIHGKSAKSRSGWKKDGAIYKNISYSKEGIYTVHPRIFKNSKQYFSKRGSMRFIGNDTIKINYGQRLNSSSKVYFVRGKEKDAEKLP